MFESIKVVHGYETCEHIHDEDDGCTGTRKENTLTTRGRSAKPMGARMIMTIRPPVHSRGDRRIRKKGETEEHVHGQLEWVGLHPRQCQPALAVRERSDPRLAFVMHPSAWHEGSTHVDNEGRSDELVLPFSSHSFESDTHLHLEIDGLSKKKRKPTNENTSTVLAVS